MPTNSGSRPPKKSRGIGRIKRLSRHVRSTKFYAADDKLFTSEMEKKKEGAAELLREIVHQWAMRKRLTGEELSSIEIPVRQAHEKIVAEQVAPVLRAVNELAAKINTLAALRPEAVFTSFGEDQNEPRLDVPAPPQERAFEYPKKADPAGDASTKGAPLQDGERLKRDELLDHLFLICRANYWLTGQTFSSVWATLDFLQRYIAEPYLITNEKYREDPYKAAVTHREDARKEGMEMLMRMNKVFKFPFTFQMNPVPPPDYEK